MSRRVDLETDGSVSRGPVSRGRLSRIIFGPSHEPTVARDRRFKCGNCIGIADGHWLSDVARPIHTSNGCQPRVSTRDAPRMLLYQRKRSHRESLLAEGHAVASMFTASSA